MRNFCGMISPWFFFSDRFLPQALRYLYIFSRWRNLWGLSYCIPILLKWKKFFSWFFTSIWRVFPHYIWCPFFGWMFLDYYCSFLLGYYYYWVVVIIVKESLILASEYFRSLSLTSQYLFDISTKKNYTFGH